MPYLPPGGLSPASAFDVEGQAEQAAPPAILAPMIDPTTGQFESVFRSRPLADAFAIEAIRVERGSGASVRDLGQRYRELRNVEDGMTEMLESYTREAFAAAEAAGVARLVGVLVEVDAVDPAQVSMTAEYRDGLALPEAPSRQLVFKP
jgi:hypothetical protein